MVERSSEWTVVLRHDTAPYHDYSWQVQAREGYLVTGSDSMPSTLHLKELGCLLWWIDGPMNAGMMSAYNNRGYAFMTCTNGPFSGGITCSSHETDDGLEILLTARISNTHDPDFDGRLVSGLSLLLRRGSQVVASTSFIHSPSRQAVVATLTVRVDELAALDGSWLFISDQGRYCWEHVHCTGCGRLADDELQTKWDHDIDPGPAGSKVLFCPACIGGKEALTYPNIMEFYRDFSVPAHPVH